MIGTKHEPIVLLTALIACLIISGWSPFDRLTWLLEVFPILIGAPLLIATYKRFPLTPLLYRLLFIHSLVLTLGAHYTYARVPIGYWLQDIFSLTRNHYDRIGHLAQGFFPAILAREILLRRSPLVPGKWLFFLVVCVCLAFSALYEMLEWWTAIMSGEAAVAFLATQGDVWDTQWDMFLALIGSLAAQIMFASSHNRSIARIDPRAECKMPASSPSCPPAS